MAALIQLSLLALALFALLCAVATWALYGWARPRLLAIEPAARVRALVGLCVTPAAGAALLTALCFLPSVRAMYGPGGDHCAGHGDGHPHFCVVHLSSARGAAAGWLIVGLVVIASTSGVVRRLARMSRARRTLAQLTHGAAFDRDRGVWRVESDLPLALTTGLVRPRVFVSSGLLRETPADLIDAVIEHERAHARRRDVLRKLIAGTLGALHLPPTRHQILADLDLAAEQASDEQAGARLGDRLQVARALIAVQRLVDGSHAELAPIAASFGGRRVADRVASLLAPPAARRSGLVGLWLAVAVLALALLAEPLHHQTETLLGALTR